MFLVDFVLAFFLLVDVAFSNFLRRFFATVSNRKIKMQVSMSSLVVRGFRHGLENNVLRSVRSRIAIVRASDDEDIVPIVTGRRKSGFSSKEYEQLRNPKLLGGKTLGQELELIRSKYLEAQQDAHTKSDTQFNSPNWDGDVYIGSRWNTLSVLYLIFMLTPALLGVFAWLSYGHLWGITPGLYN